jgi:hypothetical protein
LALRLISGLIAKIRERGIKASLERAGPWLWGKYFRNHPRWHKIIFSVLSKFERWMPLPERNKETLYAFYDLATTTPTFDIGSFMPLAEFERRQKGCRDVLVVVPANDQSLVREIGWEENGLTAKENDLWRLRHIVEPFCALYEHCRGFMICGTRREARTIFRKMAKHTYPRHYTTWIPQKHNHWRYVEELHKESNGLTTIKVSGSAKLHVRRWRDAKISQRPIVTITLRESSYNTCRNSNIKEWIRVAHWVEERGYQPVILRDTERAFSNEPKELLQWQSFPEVLWNLELRAALYEMAYLNLTVANGPSILCVTNRDVRYIQFKQATEECSMTTEAHIKEFVGLEHGQQYCTNGPFQKNVWEEDRFDIIKREFMEIEKKLPVKEERDSG